MIAWVCAALSFSAATSLLDGRLKRHEARGEMISACSVGWFVSLLVREEVLVTDLCERKILFQLEIYDRLRQTTAKQTGSWLQISL